ncbi:MAG: hypothetical protein H6706_13890 [Myxococcales bacterium]|nr:hypothetical protein [Myxococcales bacterium]
MSVPHHLALILLLVPLAARATVGGDERLELLGYEPVDGKVYFLRIGGGEAVELPRLHFLALRSDAPHAPHRVDSWYRGDPAAAEAAFPGRLAALQARLTPLPARDLEGARLATAHGDLRVCADAPRQPRTAAEARAQVAAWQRGEPDLPVCRLLTLDVTWQGFAGSTGVEAWGAPALVGVHPLPDPRFALAFVRYVGQHFESGYTVDLPVLLRREAPAEGAPSAADPRCGGDRFVPGWSAEWIDAGPWQTAQTRRFSVGDVEHAALVVGGGDRVLFAVGRAAPGGGWCVLARHEDAFGGNGVEGTLTDVLVEGDRAGLVFRQDRRYRGDGPDERVWSVLGVSPAGARWWTRDRAWPADRVRLRWRGDELEAIGARGGREDPLPFAP